MTLIYPGYLLFQNYINVWLKERVAEKECVWKINENRMFPFRTAKKECNMLVFILIGIFHFFKKSSTFFHNCICPEKKDTFKSQSFWIY